MTAPQLAPERETRLWDSSDHRTLRFDIAELNERLSAATAQDVIEWAADAFGDELVLTTSFGIQSAAMLHLATSVSPCGAIDL